ncbi:MAG: lipid-transfer protein, partial [Actinobacteria bacterium]|nr:lipid-transfer protein [Actinomycetota bacterium]
MSVDQVAVLGVGMHPWGKWGRNFVEYGVAAAQDALADAGIDWRDVGFVAGADTMRNGYPGYVAGATFAQALGWTGIPVTSAYGACASGAMALDAARQRILSGMCEVALVVGADTTPKGFLKPNKGERGDDPDWLRFRLLGMTNPAYFAMWARRRIDL